MSISNSYPTQNPVLNLNFATGSDQFLDSRISYSRSSTGTYMSSEKHLSSLNLLTNSEDFTAWTKTSYVGVSANAAAAPDGNTTADKITVTSTSNYPWTYQATGGTSGASDTVIFSVYLKMDGWRYALISPSNQSGEGVWFDLQTGTVGTEAAGSTGTITAIGSSGWYRCSVSRTGSMTVQALVALVDADNSQTGTAGGSNGVLVWGGQLTDQFSGVTNYNATTTQISREFAPTLKTSQSDQPRFEYATDGQSDAGSPRGLLIEASASNLFTYSHELNQWSGARSTIDQNSAVGPTGELTADTMRIDGSDADSHYIFQTPSVTSGTTYTCSAYVKTAGLTHCAVKFQSAFTLSLVIFNVTTGAVTSTQYSPPLSTSVTSVGNGWFRISATATATSSAAAAITIYGCDTDSSVNVATGDSFRGLLITGLQFEAGSAPSSLISTSGASASRAADSCSVVSAPLLDNGSGGLTVEYDMRDASDTSYVLHLERSVGATNGGGVSVTNRYLIVENTFEDLGVTTSNVFHKVAASWESGSQKASRDGGAIVQDTATVIPADVNTLHIGTRQDGGETVNGHIRNIAIYSEPLTSTNLTALSQL